MAQREQDPEALVDELIRLQNFVLAALLYRHDPYHLSAQLREMRTQVNKIIGAVNDAQGNIILHEPKGRDHDSDIRL